MRGTVGTELYRAHVDHVRHAASELRVVRTANASAAARVERRSPALRCSRAIADRQHGLVPPAAARCAPALSPSGISARVKRGSARIGAIAACTRSASARSRAKLSCSPAVLAAGDGAALSHDAVAELRTR